MKDSAVEDHQSDDLALRHSRFAISFLCIITRLKQMMLNFFFIFSVKIVRVSITLSVVIIGV